MKITFPELLLCNKPGTILIAGSTSLLLLESPQGWAGSHSGQFCFTPSSLKMTLGYMAGEGYRRSKRKHLYSVLQVSTQNYPVCDPLRQNRGSHG